MKVTGSKLLLILANFFYAFYQWLILILITRKLGLNSSGLYVFILAISAPVFLLLSFQFRNVIASKVNEDVNESLYFQFRLLAGVVATLLTILLLTIFSGFSLTTNNLAIALLICFIKLSDSVVDLMYGFYQKEQSLDKLTLSLLARGIAGTLLLSVIYISFEVGLLRILLSILLVNLIVIVLVDFKFNFKSIVRKSYAFSDVKKIFLSTYTLGFVAVLDSLFINGQRYVINFLYGFEVLAQYVGIVYILIVSQLVVTSLGANFINYHAR